RPNWAARSRRNTSCRPAARGRRTPSSSRQMCTSSHSPPPGFGGLVPPEGGSGGIGLSRGGTGGMGPPGKDSGGGTGGAVPPGRKELVQPLNEGDALAGDAVPCYVVVVVAGRVAQRVGRARP